MNAYARYANSLTPVTAGCLRRLHGAWHRLCLLPRPAVQTPARRIADLVSAIEAEPALRMWVQALKGKSSRVQHALLARGCEVFREDVTSGSRSLEVLENLAHPELRRAVLNALAKVDRREAWEDEVCSEVGALAAS